MDFYSIILLLAAAHGAFLAITIMTHVSEKRHGLLFLILLILAFATDLFHEFLTQTELILQFDWLRYLDPWINLFYGPTLFLYVRSLTLGNGKISFSNTGIHFLIIVFFLGVIAILPPISDEQFSRIFHDHEQSRSLIEYEVESKVGLMALTSVVSLGFYLIRSFLMLYWHSERIKSEFSSLEKITLSWLKMLVISISFMYLILLFSGYFSKLLFTVAFSSATTEALNKLLYIVIACSVYLLGYLGMRQPVIFAGQENNNSKNYLGDGDERITIRKYESSSLDEKLSKKLKDTLDAHMQQHKPFLISQLTLTQLSAQLNLAPNYLSQVINQNFEMNFFDYINGYRIEYAKRKLSGLDGNQSNILDIAFSSGFNSKSAFYTAFKKHTGVTPSEYKLSANIEDNKVEGYE
ncbi:helix-turn-helix domain-containing protein [Vibrio cholerae]|uniref:helix-turn-helix domain-containing protein n=1 Tax=Vibrio cholerae TaxID=666 RepID=UPI00053C607A|nr:helix-turn-helix transcriptional regulator [Vibrio cholerae]